MVNQEEFTKAEAIAEQEVRSVIGPISWANITSDTPFFDVLQDCICNVIDRNKEIEGSAAGKGLSSVSNDGYTESYAVTSAEALAEEKRSSIKGWLSGTGLVGAY